MGFLTLLKGKVLNGLEFEHVRLIITRQIDILPSIDSGSLVKHARLFKVLAGRILFQIKHCSLQKSVSNASSVTLPYITMLLIYIKS